MNVLQYIGGKVRLRVLSADLTRVLSTLSCSEAIAENLNVIDDFTLEFTTYKWYINEIKAVLDAVSQSVDIVSKYGIVNILRYIFRRSILCIGFLLLFLLTIYLQQRILFVRVEGNQRIPVKEIVEAAQSCDIYLGAKRRNIKNEQIKNELLQCLPDLQWVGVNTRGCVALISVKEKNIIEEQDHSLSGISSIIADREGTVTQITVTDGTAMCQVGQQIVTGQTLISGYIDCENFIKGTHAEGEVVAETNRKINAITLTNGAQRENLIRIEHKLSIQIGKKLINLYNNSSNYNADCVRIYDKEDITLPGGYELPVAFIKETVYYYKTSPAHQENNCDFQWVSDYSKNYLLSHMIPRKIELLSSDILFSDGVYVVQEEYKCLELIGVRIKERFMQ